MISRSRVKTENRKQLKIPPKFLLVICCFEIGIVHSLLRKSINPDPLKYKYNLATFPEKNGAQWEKARVVPDDPFSSQCSKYKM